MSFFPEYETSPSLNEAVDMEVMGNSIIIEDIFNIGSYGNEVIVTSYDAVNTAVIGTSAIIENKYSNPESIVNTNKTYEDFSMETVLNENIVNIPQFGCTFQSETVKTNQDLLLDDTYDNVNDLLFEHETRENCAATFGNLNRTNTINLKTISNCRRGRPKDSKKSKHIGINGSEFQTKSENEEKVINFVAESPIGYLNSNNTADTKNISSRKRGRPKGSKNRKSSGLDGCTVQSNLVKTDQDKANEKVINIVPKSEIYEKSDSHKAANLRKINSIDHQSTTSEQRNKIKQVQHREKMNESTKALKTLVPGIGHNVDKGTVIEITANYVKFLKSKISEEYDNEFLTNVNT